MGDKYSLFDSDSVLPASLCNNKVCYLLEIVSQVSDVTNSSLITIIPGVVFLFTER